MYNFTDDTQNQASRTDADNLHAKGNIGSFLF